VTLTVTGVQYHTRNIEATQLVKDFERPFCSFHLDHLGLSENRAPLNPLAYHQVSSVILSYPINNIKFTFGGITPFSDTPMLNHERDREISPLIGALLREGSDSDADSEAFWLRLVGICWNIGWNIGFTVYQIHPTKNELLAGDQQTIKKPWPSTFLPPEMPLDVMLSPHRTEIRWKMHGPFPSSPATISPTLYSLFLHIIRRYQEILIIIRSQYHL
jgi:hypothetical protein